MQGLQGFTILLLLQGAGEMIARLLDHARHLALFYPDDAKRLAQLVQVASVCGKDDNLTTRCQYPGKLAGVSRGKDHGDGVQ